MDLSLASPSGIGLGAKTTATLTIADDDATPTLQFSAASYTVNEATLKATLVVKRTGTTSDAVTVQYAVAVPVPPGSATNGLDYTLADPGSWTFAMKQGVTTQTILVPILNDAIDEGTEAATPATPERGQDLDDSRSRGPRGETSSTHP